MKIHRGLNNLPYFKNAVLTIGSFDGLHYGHRSIIQQVCDMAEKYKGESVLITFDPHPRHILDPQDKSLKLLTTLSEKLNLLKKTGLDHVVVIPFTFEFSRLEREEYLQKILIQNFHPRAIVIGYDHRFGLNRQGDVEFLKENEDIYHYKVIEIDEARISESKVSSTEIRHALKSKEIIKANFLMGHAYQLSGKVVKGLRIGNKLGYPTANLSIDDPNKLIPVDGIYAVKLRIDGRWYQGMMYIGRRPTISERGPLSVEVNIFDFHSEIYGEDVLVEIKAYIRDDMKFDDLEGLRRQISDDERVVKRLFDRMDDDSTKIPQCAVVILNYNGRQHLQEYLPLVKQHIMDKYPIIVADNQSTDDSIPYLQKEHPNVQLIVLDKNYGFAGGYNEALKRVRAKYYLLLNSDVAPKKGFPEKLIERLDSDPDIAACQPKVLAMREKHHFEYAGASGGFMDILGYPLCRGRLLDTTEEDDGQYNDACEIFWATGAAMLVRSNLFHKLGGFDAWYFAHQEEIDLCWRMKRAGYKIMVEPQCQIFHLGGGTLDYLSTKKTYLNFKNSLANILKNKRIHLAVPLIVLRLILDGAAGIYFFSKGQGSHVWAVIKAHWHFYMGLPSLLQNKIRFNNMIRQTKCGPSREKIGMIKKSLVINYYLKGKKTFKQFIS